MTIRCADWGSMQLRFARREVGVYDDSGKEERVAFDVTYKHE